MIHRRPLPGYIGLTDIGGASGRAIQFGQWLNGDGFGAYQHAYLVLDNGDLIEAEPGGARIRPLSTYDGAHVLYVAPRGLTAAQGAAIAAAGRRYEGVPYSFADYAALAAHRLHVPAPGLRAYVASSGHLICSALCDRAYQDAGVQLFADGRWDGYVTPMAIYDRLTPLWDGVLLPAPALRLAWPW